MGRYRSKRDGWCKWSGCDQRATVATKSVGVYCDFHRALRLAELRKRRGDAHVRKSTKERGYGHEHRKLRAWWAPQVERGEVRCFRRGCGRLIQPGTPWDLGHEDSDRSRYTGPEHQACNRRTSAHRAERRRRYEPNTSRDW